MMDPGRLKLNGLQDKRLFIKPFRVAVAKCLAVIAVDCTFDNFVRYDDGGRTDWFRWLGEIERAVGVGAAVADMSPGVYMQTWKGDLIPMGEVIEGMKELAEHNRRVDAKKRRDVDRITG